MFISVLEGCAPWSTSFLNLKERPELLSFKETPGIDSMESIPYNLAPLSVVMDQVKPQQCPLNVIYIRVIRGHCLIYRMGAGKYLL